MERETEKLEVRKGRKKYPNKGTRLWGEAGFQQATQGASMAEFFVTHRTWPTVPLLVTDGGKGRALPRGDSIFLGRLRGEKVSQIGDLFAPQAACYTQPPRKDNNIPNGCSFPRGFLTHRNCHLEMNSFACDHGNPGDEQG